MSEILQELADVLIQGQLNKVQDLTQKALDQGIAPEEVLQNGLLAGMDVVGKRFKDGDMFIPEVLRSAKTMHKAMEILRPILAQSEVKSQGVFLLATVEGDLHDIGKNLVAMMFEGAGFEVVNLGIDQKAQAIVQAVKDKNPSVLGLSALLTTTMPKMEETIQALQEAGLRDQVKVMVGGAPVTQEYADKIGADGYAPNAASAVDKAKELLQ
ncbi:corrinoid protein [Desulfovermiculus halophilus]|jgi:corrinoid protein of di/trimethylamine methyltransferase|uniref:corrinoid protein n=1 Tax=Desulfovermiculus halophilus TaxID=339722 RepID=UPI0004807C42|nr:corrinoid protein [Desulfovermiculus halophilus]